jgi:hypothetical protein
MNSITIKKYFLFFLLAITGLSSFSQEGEPRPGEDEQVREQTVHERDEISIEELLEELDTLETRRNKMNILGRGNENERLNNLMSEYNSRKNEIRALLNAQRENMGDYSDEIRLLLNYTEELVREMEEETLKVKSRNSNRRKM